jgi:TolB protein
MRRKTILGLGLLISTGSAGCGVVSPTDASVDRRPVAGSEASTDGPRDAAMELGAQDRTDRTDRTDGADSTDATPPTKDAGGDARRDGGGDALPHDGAADRGRAACDPTQPFGTPAPLADFNTTSDDDGLYLSDDLLTAYLSSNRTGGAGGYDLWVTTRGAVGDHFSAPTPLGAVNTPDDERQPVTSHDGLRLYFMTNHATSGTYDIAVAARGGLTATFASPAPVPGLNGTSNDTGPWISLDGTAITFASDRAGGLGGNDIYVAALGAAGASGVVNYTAVNSTADDGAPVLSRDGLTLYFSSKRAGTGARGNDDIWVARRAVATDGFAAPTDVGELNSAAADGPRWLSADSCTLYFTSDRAGGLGGYDLYQATRGQ